VDICCELEGIFQQIVGTDVSLIHGSRAPAVR
jgi:hypothetical protein